MSNIKEITSNPPIQFLADGTDALDWSIRGAPGGVGKGGINLLKQRQYAQADNLSNQSADASKRGSITITYAHKATVPAVPSDVSSESAYQQWYRASTAYIGDERKDFTADDRPCDYGHCQFFGSLKAGSYKLVCEAYVDVDHYPWVLRTHDNQNPYIALLTEDDQVLVKKSMNQPYAPTVAEPLFNGYNTTTTKFYHEEYPFTVSADTSVGFISKIYPNYNGNVFTRFQIVSSDVEAKPFTNTTYGISGVTCWEPFMIVLPLRISSPGGGIFEKDIPLNDYLTASDTVSLQTTGIAIPTFYGRNILTIDSDIPPEVYLKFNELEPIPMWAEERPAQVSVYDLHEPQSGFDHNGIAILLPSEVISDKEENGRWDLTLTHPIDQYGKWTYIIGQNVLKVNSQLYRIDSVETCIDSDSEYVQAHANHITYDMRDYWVEDAKFTVTGGDNYLASLFAHKKKDFPNQVPIVGEYVFDLASDLSGTMSADITDQSMIEAIFGADDSMVSRYGGKVYRDNFHLSVNQTLEGAPEGDAFAIRYGTDLTKLSFKIDFSEWITDLTCIDNVGALWAVWYGGDNWNIHHHKAKRVHFQYPDEKWEQEGLDRLTRDGQALWAQVSTPQITIVVSVANIKSDPKYKDYINLQNYDVGYKGTVYVEHLGIDVEMEIVSIRRNELTGEAIQITLGNSRRSMIRSTVMSQTIVSPNSVEGKNAAATQAVQKELYNTQTALMGMSIAGMEAFKISDLERRTIAELEGGQS